MANTQSCDCSRRQAVRSLFTGSLLFPAVLQQMLADTGDSLAPRVPHFPGKAKRVIFMYMPGGVSHVDSFDYKPKLIEAAETGKKTATGRLYVRPRWEFKPRGQCGIMASDLFPHVANSLDDIALIRSMRGDHNDHFQATLGIHTGSVTVARPSIGSWVSYGLGTENQNLPSFVVLAPKLPYTGSQAWSSDFLPGCHSGTLVQAGEEPVPNLTRRAPTQKLEELELGLLGRFNRKHQQSRAADPALAARIKTFETAYGMQMQMPEVLDLSKETDATLKLYGLERGSTKGFAWQCLIARRLAERGVRFIELIDVGASNNWDAHGDIKTHEPLARNVDQAAAGLIKDLKSRGMFDDTLVVWTTEFGRTPHADSPEGRGHHNNAFSSWMAGAGVKRGIAWGQSDDLGARTAENEVHVHDFHATILHLMGFDHTRLTFRYAGRDFRLTDVAGKVVQGVLA
ncbi:MAG TPA: DUF1501 domain-containing protein [Bryobacteraceae bacterium]|nr:DUF1501 domain-containing protein [Bryobacteraceae bacterium]